MSSFTHPRIKADARNEHGAEEFTYEPLTTEPAVFDGQAQTRIDRPLPVIEFE